MVYRLAIVAAKNPFQRPHVGAGLALIRAQCRPANWKVTMTEEDRQSMEDVASIYDQIMGALPEAPDTADVLAALTLVLKDVALFHHGNLFAAQRASVVALDTSFMMEAERLVSSEIH